MSEEYLAIILTFYIIIALFFAFASNSIAKNKGYDSKMYFWLGFFFSL
jgi:hypothetical protein